MCIRHNDLLPQGRSLQVVPLRTRPESPSVARIVSRQLELVKTLVTNVGQHVESGWHLGPWDRKLLDTRSRTPVPLEHIRTRPSSEGTELFKVFLVAVQTCIENKQADKQTENVLLIIVKLVKCKNEAWRDRVYMFVQFNV